jgi:quercetin dioxygenase-like cupin family protein
VLDGTGEIALKGGKEKLVAGDAILVEPNELHQFVNDGKEPFRLICVIPKPSED